MRAESRGTRSVAVAAELFAAAGSAALHEEIAEGAGVSEAIIFRHFASEGQTHTAISTTRSNRFASE